MPNKRPGTRIYFQKIASLYGPYLALYVYFIFLGICTYWPDNFLESNQSTQCSCQQELVPIQCITGKAAGRWSPEMLLVDTNSTHWLRLCFKPLCIQFVWFSTLYSYLALYYYYICAICHPILLFGTTVKPLYSEHSRDPKKCSLYGGVHPRGVRYVHAHMYLKYNVHILKLFCPCLKGLIRRQSHFPRIFFLFIFYDLFFIQVYSTCMYFS